MRTATLAVGLGVGIAVAVAIGLLGYAAGHYTNKTTTVTVAGTTTVPSASVNPQVAAGAHDFVQFACAQCHGDQGQGGDRPDVPALTGVGQSLTSQQLRNIIDHGLGESANPSKPYMPVWGEVISPHQVDDLVSYIHAGLPEEPTATPAPIPQEQGAAVAGTALYVGTAASTATGRTASAACRTRNPRTRPSRRCPGPDFRAEFNTSQKIIEIIRTGSVLGRAPIVSMPHWGGIIPETQLQALAAYIETLK